jgi:integrase
MPVKEGTRTTADYLDFDKVLNTGRKLMKEDKKRTFGFFLIVAINTGLRVSDVLTLTYEQLRENEISLFEKKTGKYRLIPVNDNIRIAFNQIDSQNKRGHVFISQKGSIFSREQLNRILKDIFCLENKKLNISTHSLRKTFGRRYWDIMNQSDSALIFLSELFNHTSVAITRRYLGIRQQELNNVYLSL